MALLTYDWKPQDPSGAVEAYLRGVALGQQQAQQQQRTMEVLGKNILAAQSEQRLEKADSLRLQYQSQEAARRALKDAPPAAYSIPEAASPITPPVAPPATGSEIAAPPAVTSGMDFPQAIPTVAGSGSGAGAIVPPVQMGVPVLGDTPHIANNAFDSALSGAQIAANTPVAPLPTPPPLTPGSLTNLSDLPTGKGLVDPRDAALLAPTVPGAPGVVRTGAQEALLPPEVVKQINTIGQTNPKLAQSLHSQATMEAMRNRDRAALAAAKPSAAGRVELYQSEKGDRFERLPDGSWKDGKEPPQGVAIARIGTRIPTSQVDGEALEWIDENTAITKKSQRLLRYNKDGVLMPVSAKQVKGTYRDPTGFTYTQFSDGTWEDDKQPKPGVDVVKIGSQQTLASPSEQIQKAGFIPVTKPGYENVVTNEDGTVLQTWKQGANGRVTYTPFDTKGSIQHLKDGRIIRVLSNGTTQEIANASAIPAKDQTDFTTALKRKADADDAVNRLDAVMAANGEKGVFNSKGAKKEDLEKARLEQAAAQREVGVYQSRYPTLSAAPKTTAAEELGGPVEYKTPLDVKAAVKSGKLSYDDGAKMLREKFGYK